MKSGVIYYRKIVSEKCPNGHSFCLSPRCWLGVKDESG